MSASAVKRYLGDKVINGPWRISGRSGNGCAGAVVIPALAESDRLFATLATLATNPIEYLDRFLVLVVVNHREDATNEEKSDNLHTLAQLAEIVAGCMPLRLAWVDAASPGLELPLRDGGVGLARKIGLDLALQQICEYPNDPILVCLDADTLVEPDYLAAIEGHFQKSPSGGAVIPFCHQEGASEYESKIITLYELFLRSYVFGLSLAASPYAFHTVGSAMACRASAYVRAGGMNRRRAGEDFYFLQQLKKTGGVEKVKGTVVWPAPRPSHRVPFGTGRTMANFLAGDTEAITFYHHACFTILREWLATATRHIEEPGILILDRAGKISTDLAAYLETEDFTDAWDGIRRNHRNTTARLKAFHDWFDAFRTMRLVHHLSSETFPRSSRIEAVTELLSSAGLPLLTTAAEQLALLRKQQNRPEP